MIASSIPIIQDGQVIGVFAHSVFLDILDAKEMIENLLSQINMYKREISTFHQAKYSFDDLIGSSQEFIKLIKIARQIAKHPDTTVLITGESGTGKELLANSIHNRSSRSSRPFIRVNCTAIPENLLETELFGYEEGAYTGAKKRGKPGKFELAQGGTIFLDEIGEMSFVMQSKLLTVLQEYEVERVGGSRPIILDVRVIAATNRDLNQMVTEGAFRQDLYFRLNVFHLEMIPLRAHKEDIAILIEHFLKKFNVRLRVDIKGISDKTIKSLEHYQWPGNVRELENVMERAMIIADMEGSSMLSRRHFGFLNTAFDVPVSLNQTQDLKTITQDFERQVIKRAMQEANNDILTAAKLLSIDRTTLYRKLKKYNFPFS
ncbi:MAG: sigma 54-interacting transcriptional regulator [Desulfitobacteriaceae bacterium]|nr:sigma 54-interacting transcriptional regulator [Desulfitobacteriaceae bacterium]MDD4753877.1 sigma 54-interacting transcriptional regulator [Desulfitobacteriaceae bacterium]